MIHTEAEKKIRDRSWKEEVKVAVDFWKNQTYLWVNVRETLPYPFYSILFCFSCLLWKAIPQQFWGALMHLIASPLSILKLPWSVALEFSSCSALSLFFSFLFLYFEFGKNPPTQKKYLNQFEILFTTIWFLFQLVLRSIIRYWCFWIFINVPKGFLQLFRDRLVICSNSSHTVKFKSWSRMQYIMNPNNN